MSVSVSTSTVLSTECFNIIGQQTMFMIDWLLHTHRPHCVQDVTVVYGISYIFAARSFLLILVRSLALTCLSVMHIAHVDD